MRLFPVLLVCCAAIFGCESGVSWELHTDEAPSGLGSPEAPMFLRAGVDKFRTDEWSTATIGVLCGNGAHAATDWSHFDGFGGIDQDFVGTEAAARLWLAPVPPTWDLEGACTLTPDGSGVVNVQSIRPEATENDTADTADSADPTDTADTSDTGDASDTADSPDTTLDFDGLDILPDPSWPIATGDLLWSAAGGGSAEGHVDFPN